MRGAHRGVLGGGRVLRGVRRLFGDGRTRLARFARNLRRALRHLLRQLYRQFNYSVCAPLCDVRRSASFI